MGLFSRHAREGPVPPTAATTTTTNTGRGFFGRRANDTHDTHERKHPLVLSMNQRPPFGQWLKATWLDIVTMAAMGIIGLGVYTAHPAPTRLFPVYFQDGEVVYPEFAYPLRKNIIPIYLAALLASLVPILIILLCQIRVRSFWDTNNAIIGLLYSLINAAVFQVFLKWLIGGLRPHFLAVCQPVLPDGIETGTGLKQIMYDRSICTGDQAEIDDSLESFPSGHSTAAFAGFVFLSLYLNAKLKVFSNYHPAFWKLIAIYAPILAATLIAGSLTIDEYHNWYDCLAGAVIGTMMAFSSYRMVYASVWDFRFNHIPLNRAVPFSFGAGEMELRNAVFTRKAGWGFDEGVFGGAPFDAAGGMGGSAGLHSGGMTGTGIGHRHHNGTGYANEPMATTGHNRGLDTIGRKEVAPREHVHGDAMV